MFATIEKLDSENDILKFLNEKHPKIKFTIEKEKNNLPFLDTRVIRNVGKYITKIYHKKTLWSIFELEKSNSMQIIA